MSGSVSYGLMHNQVREENERKARNSENKRKYNKEMAKYNHLNNNSSVEQRLQALHNTGRGNRFYRNRLAQYRNNNKEGTLNRLNRHHKKKKYGSKRGKRGARGYIVSGTINKLRKEVQSTRRSTRLPENNIEKLLLDTSVARGGSKKRKQQVKGRRVLRNGAVAGYVKQRDGTWKWRFLPR